MACKDEFVGNDYSPVSSAQPFPNGQQWMKLLEVESGGGNKVNLDYIPLMCQHCETMPCARLAPERAVYKRSDGIVIIDPVKAVGCKEIADACPYRAVAWNPALRLAQKCTLCAHLLDRGEMPRCVECCPTEALVFGDIEDAESAVFKLSTENVVDTEVYKPDFCTNPMVKYLNIPKPFIAGEIVYRDDDSCAENIPVILIRQSTGATFETRSDFMGDFKFKKLIDNEVYTLKIDLPDYKAVEIELRANASKDIGLIYLEKI
jgi:Fe-S-cluster-containing dehydrogenase component